MSKQHTGNMHKITANYKSYRDKRNLKETLACCNTCIIALPAFSVAKKHQNALVVQFIAKHFIVFYLGPVFLENQLSASYTELRVACNNSL